MVYEAPVPEVVERTFDGELSRLAAKYGQDENLARKIMKCESSLYKEANNKNYNNGKLWSTDWGWWQINDYFWEKEFQERGLDIHNEWDNLEAGFILMSEQGTRPWHASKKCWG